MKTLQRRQGPAVAQHIIRQHAGSALLRSAMTYPTLLKTIVEAVQNAVDKDVKAKRIEVFVDLMQRNAYIRDNGCGTTLKKFKSALATVGTPFRKGQDALGQFGLGLISPLNKCDRFIFTSKPRGRGVPTGTPCLRWTFECRNIIESAEESHIPVSVVEQSTESGTKWWSSEMYLEGITKDRAVSEFHLSEIQQHIVATIGKYLRREGTKLSIKIRHKDGTIEEVDEVKVADFTGDPLRVYVIDTDHAGKVKFVLYRRTSKAVSSREPRVLFGKEGRDDRITVRNLHLCGLLAGSPALPILRCGFFEGEITAERISLKAQRDSFVEDDALIDLGVALEIWAKEIGQGLMEEIKGDSRTARRQETALKSLAVVEQILKRPEFSTLKSMLDGLVFGTVGDGHAPSKVIKALPEVTGKTVAGSKVGNGETPTVDPQRSATPTPKSGHVPHTAIGPRGGPRNFVKGHSTGLIVEHDTVETSMRPYVFDRASGRLTINLRHPAWTLVEDEGSDRQLEEFQTRVILAALREATIPEALRAGVEVYVDAMLASDARLIVDGSKVRRDIKADL